jgi:hypothetical protein
MLSTDSDAIDISEPMMRLKFSKYFLLLAMAAGLGIGATALTAVSATARNTPGCQGGGRAPQDAASAPLRRQLAALQKIQRQRNCRASDTGGLFNGCRDLGRRIAALESSIAPSQVSQRRCAPAAKLQATRPKAVPAPAKGKPAKPRGKERKAAGRAAGGEGIPSMCVRLSDGYFFPSPNSGYAVAAGPAAILAQCQIICATADMAVYRASPEGAGGMRALEGGSAYRDLPNAGRFYASPTAERCDQGRYSRLVARLQKKADREAGIFGVVPTPRPVSLADRVEGWELRPSQRQASRSVRLIGTPYYPDTPRGASADRQFSARADEGTITTASLFPASPD